MFECELVHRFVHVKSVVDTFDIEMAELNLEIGGDRVKWVVVVIVHEINELLKADCILNHIPIIF